ncbi:MAG: phosphoribosylaminoimidazolesuccinocarboxamide synthase [Planctomycetes bacterium]|nr:phosphoribosylaminoimidazolesuccinocarboxamide synthase [Planctomycetota bacterium]
MPGTIPRPLASGPLASGPLASGPLVSSSLPGDPYPVRRGKVRDIYDLGDRLLMVSTDRISAFDWVLPTGIPDKGRVLTMVSAFWFEKLGVPNHLLTLELDPALFPEGTDIESLRGRSMIVRKAEVVPIECVVRGYLDGSGWREYQKDGTVCGLAIPAGLSQCAELAEPIFTPATKEESGHDINISFDVMSDRVGTELARELRSRSLDLYRRGAALARQRGLIIADTKFEWGQVDGELILIDEVLTPDSSRYWPADRYAPGAGQPSFDKQFTRDWLSATPWDKNSPPPALPDDIVLKTREKYIEAYERLTGTGFPWK